MEEILMQPCCLERIHRYFPQYIPTLFPYSNPIFDPTAAELVELAEPSRSAPSISRHPQSLQDSDSTISQPRRISLPSKIAENKQ